MDLRTGQIYATRDEAIAAGVPESDIVEIDRMLNPRDEPQEQPTLVDGTGPFKGRKYRRDARTGGLVRVR